MTSVNDPSRFKTPKSDGNQTFINDPSRLKSPTRPSAESEKTVSVPDNQQYGGEEGYGTRKRGFVYSVFNAIGIGVVIFIASIDFITRFMGFLMVCAIVPFMIYVYFFSEKAVEMRREAREAREAASKR